MLRPLLLLPLPPVSVKRYHGPAQLTPPPPPPHVSTRHRGADNFQGIEEDAPLFRAPGTQIGMRLPGFDLIKQACPPSLVSAIVLEIALTCQVITSNEQLGGWLSQ